MSTTKAQARAQKRVEEISPKYDLLTTSFFSLQESVKQQIQAVEKEKEDWEASKQLMKKIEFKDAEIISLNVGGKLFSTSIDTLKTLIPYGEDEEDSLEEAEDHLLRAMFFENFELQKDKHGNIFLDRDPKLFGYILNFLRCQGRTEDFVVPSDGEKKQALIIESRFFNLRKLEHILKGEYKGSQYFPGASITQEQMKTLNNWYGKSHQRWKLLFKSSTDGGTSAHFHAKCDGKGPTITILYTTSGNIIGGYLDKSWHSSNGYIQSNNSWIFSLVSPYEQAKFKCKQTSQAAMGHNHYGPCFGTDIQISSDLSAMSSYSLGSCYVVPNHHHSEQQLVPLPSPITHYHGSFGNTLPQLRNIEVFTPVN